VACDYLITPLRMDRLSLKGLSRMASALTSFEDSYGRSPTPIVIPSLFQKNRPRVQRNLGMLMQHFGRDVTENYLHASEDFPKALDDGFPVILWKNAQPIVREEFRKLSKEIIQKIIRETGEKKQNSDKKDNGDKS
jgi:chromosome partitioning protein